MDDLVPDRQLLQWIYEMYRPSYPGPTVQKGVRAGHAHENDPYTPIDIRAVATKANMSPEILFGRLYYDIGNRYSYKVDDKTTTRLFQFAVGDRKHCVHFPYLTAVLAGLKLERRHRMTPYGISSLAVVVSVASLFIK